MRSVWLRKSTFELSSQRSGSLGNKRYDCPARCKPGEEACPVCLAKMTCVQVEADEEKPSSEALGKGFVYVSSAQRVSDGSIGRSPPLEILTRTSLNISEEFQDNGAFEAVEMGSVHRLNPVPPPPAKIRTSQGSGNFPF